MAVSSPNQQKFWSSRDWTLTIQHQMADYRRDVGRRLRALRTTKNMSQEDAAHVVGVRVKTWGLWERGVSSPYERSWQKIKTGFGLADDQVSAIRGKPPAPLGLDDEPSVGEVVSLLRGLEERLTRIEDLLTEREFEELEADVDPPKAPPAGRRASGDV